MKRIPLRYKGLPVLICLPMGLHAAVFTPIAGDHFVTATAVSDGETLYSDTVVSSDIVSVNSIVAEHAVFIYNALSSIITVVNPDVGTIFLYGSGRALTPPPSTVETSYALQFELDLVLQRWALLDTTDSSPFNTVTSGGASLSIALRDDEGNLHYIIDAPDGQMTAFPEATVIEPGAYTLTMLSSGNHGPVETPAATGSTQVTLQFMTILDGDGDDINDDSDNCTVVANAAQRDTDGDGIGNACDPDIAPVPVNDCVVNFEDLGMLKNAFFSVPG